MHEMALFMLDSEDEGSELGVQLVDDDRVEGSPIPSVSPSSSTIAEEETQGAGAFIWTRSLQG